MPQIDGGPNGGSLIYDSIGDAQWPVIIIQNNFYIGTQSIIATSIDKLQDPQLHKNQILRNS